MTLPDRHGAPRLVAFTLLTAGLTGCTGAPALNVVGSFFPAWMFAAVVGIATALCLRQVFVLLGLERHIIAPLLTHTLVAIAVTLAVWLLWFGH